MEEDQMPAFARIVARVVGLGGASNGAMASIAERGGENGGQPRGGGGAPRGRAGAVDVFAAMRAGK
eukprot:SAG11_NODE_36329_length_262_cov_0.631902_1_plen_66_part_01